MPRAKPEYKGIAPEAVRAFQAHRTNARRRGIPFLFTFTEWWEWWQTDNRWANRGMGGDKFVMARKGDTGPYSPENVYCATHLQNNTDMRLDARNVSRAAKEGWKTKRANGLSFVRRGSRHHASRAVETPAGRFETIARAAEHFGLTKSGVIYRAKTGKDGWRFVEAAE